MRAGMLPLTTDIEESLLLSCDSSLNSGDTINKLGAKYYICIVEHSFFKGNHYELTNQTTDISKFPKKKNRYQKMKTMTYRPTDN